LQQTLLAEGADKYEVQTATSGEEALQFLQGYPYDLILVDLKMPGIDGLQLIEAVRQVDPETRIILMTAYGSMEVEEQAERLSVFRYMTKPFYVEDLRQAVHDALGGGGAAGKGILILSAERYEGVTSRLHELQSNIGCQCVFLADVVGQIVMEVGHAPGLDLQMLATVIGGRFAATFEMARLLGSNDAYNLDYHEGEDYDVYSTNVGDNLILTIVFDRHVQPSKLGSVWYYAKRAIEDILAMMHTVEVAGAVPSAVEIEAPPPPPQVARRVVPEPAPAAPPPPGVAFEKPAPPAAPDTGRRQLFNLDQARSLGLIPEEFLSPEQEDE
jgi:two-component system response regulator (stage 0 sporulation protein F)